MIINFSFRTYSIANVKVVQAKFKRLPDGRPDFTKLSQTFVEVNETTVNVTYLLSVINEKWGAECVLVTADRLQINDIKYADTAKLVYTSSY